MLALVATSLESLYVGRPWNVRFESFVPPGDQLTVLQDLALCGATVGSSASDFAWHLPAHDLMFPGLRRIHIYGVLRGTVPLGVIARAAPGLQRLRISGVNADDQFPALLGEALGMWKQRPNTLLGAGRKRLPETVRFVTVEAYARDLGRPDQKHHDHAQGL